MNWSTTNDPIIFGSSHLQNIYSGFPYLGSLSHCLRDLLAQPPSAGQHLGVTLHPPLPESVNDMQNKLKISHCHLKVDDKPLTCALAKHMFLPPINLWHLSIFELQLTCASNTGEKSLWLMYHLYYNGNYATHCPVFYSVDCFWASKAIKNWWKAFTATVGKQQGQTHGENSRATAHLSFVL